MAKSIDSDYAFNIFEQKAKNDGFEIGLYQKVAELIGKELSEKWYIDDTFKSIRAKYHDDIVRGTEPIKIEIAEHIKNNSKNTMDNMIEEINLLKDISRKSIAGVITTNYDLFLENIMNNYKVYIGQEELIFYSYREWEKYIRFMDVVQNPNLLLLMKKIIRTLMIKNNT